MKLQSTRDKSPDNELVNLSVCLSVRPFVRLSVWLTVYSDVILYCSAKFCEQTATLIRCVIKHLSNQMLCHVMRPSHACYSRKAIHQLSALVLSIQHTQTGCCCCCWRSRILQSVCSGHSDHHCIQHASSINNSRPLTILTIYDFISLYNGHKVKKSGLKTDRKRVLRLRPKTKTKLCIFSKTLKNKWLLLIQHPYHITVSRSHQSHRITVVIYITVRQLVTVIRQSNVISHKRR